MGNDSPKPAREDMVEPVDNDRNPYYYNGNVSPQQQQQQQQQMQWNTMQQHQQQQQQSPGSVMMEEPPPQPRPFDYPPYVLIGAHYNQQLVAQQQYGQGYQPRTALSSIPTGDYAQDIQNYYRNLYASMGIPGTATVNTTPGASYYPQQAAQPGVNVPYGMGAGPWGPIPGMLPNGGVPIGDGSMVMYETADPYDDPLQQPHWHRRNRPESGYVVNIVRMNPGGTLQERPNQF